MQFNLELAEAVLSQVTKHPEQHDQEEYGYKTVCGTRACIAGWTLLLGGKARFNVWNRLSINKNFLPVAQRWITDNQISEYHYRTDTNDFEPAAAALLGIDEPTATDLFSGDIDNETAVALLTAEIKKAKRRKAYAEKKAVNA